MENRQQSDLTLHKWALWTTLVFCLIGAALAFYSTQLTFKIAQHGLEEPSGCSFNAWISCDAVFATSDSRLLGIPVSWWGLLFYAWTAFVSLFGGLTKNRERAASALSATLLLSFGAVGFSIYKAYHLYVLQVLCPVCVGMYIANLVITVLLIKTLNLSFGKVAPFFIQYFKRIFGKETSLQFSPQPLLFLALITSLFSLGHIGINVYEGNGREKENMDRALEDHFSQKVIEVSVDSNAAVWGNPDADITLVEFSDFECPACRFSAFHLRSILFEYRNQVRLYFMNYPLDSGINKYIRRNIHPKAGLAARAGVCAEERGDFWNYHDDLFRDQKKLTRQMMLNLAEMRGWNTAEFDSCMNREPVIQRVRDDIAHGKAAGVNSTPTLFINGRKIRFWNNNAFIRSIVRQEVKRERKIPDKLNSIELLQNSLAF